MPKTAEDLFNEATQVQRQGHLQEAMTLYRQVVQLDPSFAPAHLFLGSALEQINEIDHACESYHRAFAANPKLETAHGDPQAPKWLGQMTSAALTRLRAKYMKLHETVLEDARTQYPDEDLSRIEECVAIQHGTKRADYADKMQRPGSVYIPGIQPRAWFERDEFDWVPALEAAYPAIRQELEGLMTLDEKAIAKPYVNEGPNVPESMQHLAGTYDWHATHLYSGGTKNDANCERCPKTTEAVERLPQAKMYGNAPEAFFSFLKPGAHIKPHFGVANSKTAVHLALSVPRDCAIRVGEETRTWTEGQCLIFDDSFEHEAWNRSEQLRVVLILEIWNPYLTNVEKQTLYALSRAIEDWAAQDTG